MFLYFGLVLVATCFWMLVCSLVILFLLLRLFCVCCFLLRLLVAAVLCGVYGCGLLGIDSVGILVSLFCYCAVGG